MKRRDAREAAFLLIFEKSFRPETIDELMETAVEGRELKMDDYARRLARLVGENPAALDEKIAPHLATWKLSRLPRVTLAALRMAVCELDSFPDIPVRVSINEAIELAKKYGTEEDASYVNGVLGSYVKAAAPHKAEDAPEPEACEER